MKKLARAENVQMYLDQAQVGGNIHYLIERPSYPEESRFYYADLDNLDAIHKWTPRDLYINLIGLVYLFVGFFVLFKQGGRAPFALHFAALCLAAFVFHSYTPVGTYRDLDLAIAFLKNAAFILFPPLFLHFCLRLPGATAALSARDVGARLCFTCRRCCCWCWLAFVFLRDVLTPLVPPLRQRPAVSESFVGLFYRLSFAHFVAGAGCQRLFPDPNLDQGEERGRSAADEVGGLGLAAGRRAVHAALWRRVICWARKLIPG